MMNLTRRPYFLLCCICGVLATAVFLYWLAGHGETSSWPANAVNNWNQYGIVALHGKMVVNPGGYDALTQPDVYKGHRAASLYPVYAVGKILSWLGDSLLMFHVVFTLALFVSTWFLLGRSPLAALGAGLAALCPGYFIYPTVVDPNAMALYLVVPFAAIIVPMLCHATLSAPRLIVLAVLTYLYTSLNWSTAFGHGILFCTLLVMPAITWRRLAIYAGLAGLSIGVVGSLSVLDKMTSGPGTNSAAGGGDIQTLLLGYTWGHISYGSDLTTIKAIVRLTVTNSIGMLPLLLFTGYLAVKFRGTEFRFQPKMFLPLLAAGLGVMTMRNYFGHHPWMAATMVLPGLILTLTLIFQGHQSKPVAAPPITGKILFIGGSLIYSVLILGAWRAYHAEPWELTALVLKHTARTDTLVLVKSLDPEMATQAKSVAESCDRHVILISDLTSSVEASGNLVVLSATDLSGQLSLAARSEKPALLNLPLIREGSAWYAKTIARRAAKDHHFEFTKQASFGLYRLPATAH